MKKACFLLCSIFLTVSLCYISCDDNPADPANNTPTDITLSSSSVAENQDAGTAVGSFSTTDADAADAHTYTLVSGTGSDDNASFTISGTQLLTASAFDYETKSSYTIRVQTDDGNDGTYQKAFTISVTDVNEIDVDGVAIFTEKTTTAPIPWTDIHVWTAGETITLNGTSPDAFEGDTAMAATDNSLGWNGWGFAAPSYDISAYANGKLHLAVKGTSPDLGISVNADTYVMASAYGYTPNGGWAEISIPISAFNLTSYVLTTYIVSFLQTVENGAYSAGSIYSIDDVYLTKN